MRLGPKFRRAGALPVEVTGFVGRVVELDQVRSALRSARLVTVTGPGGVGKTRLALRAAAAAAGDYPDGVRLVELSELRDPELLPHTLANALDLHTQDLGSTLDAVVDHLRDRTALIVLDTCEHLIDACALLADLLLRAAPGVALLATSRQPLDVAGEHTLPIAPLPLHGDGGDALRLFEQCAAAAVPGFTVDADNRADALRLCRRLDGMPLAIELASVRLRVLDLRQLLERLEDRFRLLGLGQRSVPSRHQTLRTAIEWSHELCTGPERALWARLSVFAGSFDLPAVEEVCAGGELTAEDVLLALVGLVDKSVLQRVHPGGSRYRMLDTLREFGAEQLAGSGEEEAQRERHLARYLTLARSFDRDFLADDQIPRYHELLREHTDLRLAVEYALAAPGHERDAAALTGDLWGFWHIAGLHTEARYWYAKIADRFPGRVPERAWALARSSYLGAFQADPLAVRQAREALSIAEQLDDPVLTGRSLAHLHLSLTFMGRDQEATRAAERAHTVLTAAGDRVGLVILETQAGYMHFLRGELDLAFAQCERGLARLGEDSAEGWVRGYLHFVVGAVRFGRGEYRQGALSAVTALRIKHELGDGVGLAYCLVLLALLAEQERRFGDAVRLIGAADPLWQGAGARLGGNATMEQLHEGAVRAAREALGADRCAALRADGARQPIDQVVARAVRQNAEGADRGAGSATDRAPGAASGRRREPAPGRPVLTPREDEVALLAAEGRSNREIAEHLVISKRTVDTHMERILAKLGVPARGHIAGARSAAYLTP